MSSVLYLLLLIAIIIILFAGFRRPMYEIMLIGFLAMVVVTGTLENFWIYLETAARSSILYTIVGFVAFSYILDRTGVIHDFIDIIMALVGRFSGGAGYVALFASSILGSLSGSGTGNAAAIGTIAIPTMIRSGYSRELAAAVEAASSALGVVIPPSGTIAAVFGVLMATYPNCCTFSEFWMLMWGISFWFILQRVVTLFICIKVHKIKPIPKEERMPLGKALKKGWRVILLPVIILAPFMFDAMISDTFIVTRLGESGAKIFSKSLLAMTPSIAIAFVIWIGVSKGNKITFNSFFRMFESAINNIAPVTMMVFGGLAISEVFQKIGIGDAIAQMMEGLHIELWMVALVFPVVFAFLGMFLEGLTIIYMLGNVFIIMAHSVGINPILAAAMLPVVVTVMGYMTPPFAITFHICLGIADADFLKATKIIILWCVTQYIVQALILFGVLPVPGLVPFA